MNKPLITVITVCYNVVSSIEETILSVINQTYPNIEYIIIDGGSTDGTIDIIKKYKNRISIWISEPDKGIYYAMNKGIKLATGEWINFMNCGDSFYSNTTIEDVFNMANSTSDIIYGNTNLLLDIGKFVKKGTIATLQDYMPFVHQSSFSRTSLMKEYRFDTKYKICADRNFFFTAYKNKFKFEYIDKTISNYEAEAGISSVNTINLMYEKGMIEGINENLYWKFKFFLYKIQFKIKKCIKKILPTKILRNIRLKRADNFYYKLN